MQLGTPTFADGDVHFCKKCTSPFRPSERDRHTEQISVQIQLEFSSLHLCQSFCNGQSQPASLRASGDVSSDEALGKFIG